MFLLNLSITLRTNNYVVILKSQSNHRDAGCLSFVFDNSLISKTRNIISTAENKVIADALNSIPTLALILKYPEALSKARFRVDN